MRRELTTTREVHRRYGMYTYVECGYGYSSGTAWIHLYPHRLRRRGLFEYWLAYDAKGRCINQIIDRLSSKGDKNSSNIDAYGGHQ